MKLINSNKNVYQLCKEYPEIKNILADLGFDAIKNPVMFNTVAKVMTIDKASKMKNIDMKEIIKMFEEKGFIFDNNKNGNQKIKCSHYRNNNIQYFYRCIFPQHDDCSQSHKKNSRKKRRDGKCIIKGRGYGIADNLTDSAPTEQTGQGKQDTDDTAFFSFCKKIMDIIGRTAPVSSV